MKNSRAAAEKSGRVDAVDRLGTAGDGKAARFVGQSGVIHRILSIMEEDGEE